MEWTAVCVMVLHHSPPPQFHSEVMGTSGNGDLKQITALQGASECSSGLTARGMNVLVTLFGAECVSECSHQTIGPHMLTFSHIEVSFR